MRRAIIVALLASTATAGAEAQAPRRAPPQVVVQPEPVRRAVIQPGTYQTTGFVTRFDAKGGWTTTATGTSASGRYAIDGDLVIFQSAQPTCENERTTYRIVPDAEGFRLVFVADSCKRAGDNLRFVPIKQIAKPS